MMEWIIFTLAAFCTAYAELKLYDAPPRITYPTGLDNPENLNLVANLSHVPNRFLCEAENADAVVWKYLSKIGDTPQDMIPKPFEQQQQEEKDNKVFRVLAEVGRNHDNVALLNGYYQCFAYNSKFNRGYVTMTPPIRLFVPVMKSKDLERPRTETGNLGAPLRMKCIYDRVSDDISPDISLWNIVHYEWVIGTIDIKNKIGSTTSIVEDERIKIDPRSGDLFFAYLNKDDSLGHTDNDPMYRCLVTLAFNANKVIASQTRLVVTSVEESDVGYVLQSPVTHDDQNVVCMEKKTCRLSCIYGGKEERKTPEWRLPDGVSLVLSHQDSIVSFTAQRAAIGQWSCGLTGRPEARRGTFNVNVELFPMLTDPFEMTDQVVEVGTPVEFLCSPEGVNQPIFYINGERIRPHYPLYVDYKEGSSSIAIRSDRVTRNISSEIVCVVSNTAGTLFKSARLNVYSKPGVQMEPEGGYVLTKNDTQVTQEFLFFCTMKLDEKTENARIFWKTDHSDFQDQEIDRQMGDGIKKVISNGYNRRTNEIGSELRLFLDTATVETLPGALWWCVVEMTLYGTEKPVIIESKKAPFTLANVQPGPTIEKAGFQDWWVIGVIVAIVFFLLLIILIIFCVKQNQGEQYYVDEKERKAGHDPEKEMDGYGLLPYKRPATGGYMPIYMSDQDPIKGSRTSIDMSDKMMDSDRGSMDEYGDIDPGRFNEDGSFIGQYGKSSNHVDV